MGLSKLPALAVVTAEVLLRLGRVANPHRPGVPLQALAGTIGDVAKMVRLGQQPAVAEVARRRSAGLAGSQPLRVMADRLGNRSRRIFEPRELLLRQQDVLAVVGQEHSLGADEEDAAVPMRDLLLPEHGGPFTALRPGD